MVGWAQIDHVTSQTGEAAGSREGSHVASMTWPATWSRRGGPLMPARRRNPVAVAALNAPPAPAARGPSHRPYAFRRHGPSLTDLQTTGQLEPG